MGTRHDTRPQCCPAHHVALLLKSAHHWHRMSCPSSPHNLFCLRNLPTLAAGLRGRHCLRHLPLQRSHGQRALTPHTHSRQPAAAGIPPAGPHPGSSRAGGSSNRALQQPTAAAGSFPADCAASTCRCSSCVPWDIAKWGEARQQQ